jgi:nucleotide-binding universal stress UspA family protein
MPTGDAPLLVGVDFSPDSEAALRWAARLASQLRAPLLVLHVIHDPAEAPGTYARAAAAPLERAEDVARTMLEGFVGRVREQEPALRELAEAELCIVRGLPEGRILELADERRARLVVMGGRGRTRLADLLLGSKTERVARMACAPVAIIKAGREPD